MRIVHLIFALAIATPAFAQTKPLAELNPLAKSLFGKVKLEALSELDVAEVVAARDAVRAPSPMAIAYAAAIEKIVSEKPKNFPLERGEHALLALALDLSSFGGAQAELFEALFAPALDALERVKEPKPRPELDGELAEIGAWATRTVERLAQKLPAEESARARVRLAMERGRWGEAAQIAERMQGKAKKPDPRWQGYLGAALTMAGREKEAAPYVAASEHAGGEAERQVELAHVRRVNQLAVDGAARALKSLGVGGLSVAQGGRARAVDGACRKLFEAPPASSATVGQAAVSCATVLWERPDRGWLPRAAKLVPDGAAGAPVRAAAALMRLLPDSGKRPDEAERKAALAEYQARLAEIPERAGPDRALLSLLGFLGASANPTAWTAAAPEERALLDGADKAAPCDAHVFAMRAVAARPERGKLGLLVEDVIRRCADAPGGAAVTIDAVELYLQLHHESPPAAPDDLEPAILAFSRAHEDDAESVGAHADAVALKALAKHSRPGIEAALSRYETAVARWSPAGGAQVRQRLEANAGFLSIALGRMMSDKEADAQAKLYIRAAGHLRQALSLGEIPSITATRAAYDVDTGTGMTDTTIDLEHLPPSRARNRAACAMAEQAAARGDAVVTRQLLALARQKPHGEEHKLTVPELLVETNASLSVRVEEQELRPFVDLKTSIFLAPACDPELVKVPPDVKPQAQKPPATK